MSLLSLKKFFDGNNNNCSNYMSHPPVFAFGTSPIFFMYVMMHNALEQNFSELYLYTVHTTLHDRVYA